MTLTVHPEASLLAHRFAQAQRLLPLVAILRGLQPAEAIAVGKALAEAGFHLIEVPLNSPDPFNSIEQLRRHLPPEVLVGAGTVLQPEQLARLVDVGADLAVMPHADVALIQAERGDRWGNLVYRKSARNFNPVCAMAAELTVVEVETMVELGTLDPEAVVTPGIFVDRIVVAEPLKIRS